jgi:ribonuclease HI
MNAIFYLHSACFSFLNWFYFAVMILKLTCMIEICLHYEEMFTCSHHLTWSLQLSCILEFAGARKGNPSKSGAGVIVRRTDGSVVCTTITVLVSFLSLQLPWPAHDGRVLLFQLKIAQLREGLGSVTDKTAEYRALLLGLTYAVNKGFKYIRAQGNSQSVCYQVCGYSFATLQPS